MATIFIVDDDQAIGEMLSLVLENEGFQTVTCLDGLRAVEMFPIVKPDLILLDVMLPGLDGTGVARRIRATSNVPIIMLTAKSDTLDVVAGLEAGADDYVPKPFGMMEMVSRVKAVLRRAAPKNGSSKLVAGDLALNPGEHTVLSKGRRVQLTLKEYELLKLFMENIGMVFTRDLLMTKIWGSDFVGETRTVDVHIGTLRTKLGPCGEYIETVRGVGYRMEVHA